MSNVSEALFSKPKITLAPTVVVVGPPSSSNCTIEQAKSSCSTSEIGKGCGVSVRLDCGKKSPSAMLSVPLATASARFGSEGCCSSMVERHLGKVEVVGSI